MKASLKELVTGINGRDGLNAGINGSGGLNKLANINLPVKLAYRFGRLMDSARSAVTQGQKERAKLFDELGAPEMDPDGNETGNRTIPIENQAMFIEQLDAFLDGTKLTIWYQPTKLSELEAAGVALTPSDMITLAPFIDTEDGSEG